MFIYYALIGYENGLRGCLASGLGGMLALGRGSGAPVPILVVR